MYTNISIKFPRHTGKTKLFSSLIGHARKSFDYNHPDVVSRKRKRTSKETTKTQNRKLVTSLGEWKTTCQTLLRAKMMFLWIFTYSRWRGNSGRHLQMSTLLWLTKKWTKKIEMKNLLEIFPWLHLRHEVSDRVVH